MVVKTASKGSALKQRHSIGRPHKPAAKVKKQRRRYTEKELGVTTLNGTVPVGVEKPKGKKKGKIFVDDQASMMAILGMVSAEKEGQIESKLLQARQLEQIREAKRKESETRHEEKSAKFEEVKQSFRRKRGGKERGGKERGGKDIADEDAATVSPKITRSHTAKNKKRVSFAAS